MHDLQVAYADYLGQTRRITLAGAWSTYADLFTETAVYRRTGMPDRVGREEIRRQLVSDAAGPGTIVERTEVHWCSLDAATGRVVQELRHVARDPGDGSVHQALATSMLTYAGDGLWSSLTVVHSPEAYRTMYRSWARAARACGRTREAREVLDLLQADAAVPGPHQGSTTASSSRSWPTEASSSRTTR